MKRLAFVLLAIFATAFAFTDPITTGQPWTVTNVAQIQTRLTALEGATTAVLVGGGTSTAPVWTTATGTGAPVRATGPALVMPNLGVPSAVTLTNATGLPIATGVSGLGTGISTALAVNTGAAGAPAILIASGAKALATGAITSGSCATDTATATGVASTDAIAWNPNADITAVTGYVPTTAGGLAVYVWPTTNTLNVKVCNPTASSITPGAVTLNWRVVR